MIFWYVENLNAREGARSRSGEAAMWDDEDHWSIVVAMSMMMLLVLVACFIHYLPRDFAIIAVSWITLSISVGITFGHCVLSEQ